MCEYSFPLLERDDSACVCARDHGFLASAAQMLEGLRRRALRDQHSEVLHV